MPPYIFIHRTASFLSRSTKESGHPQKGINNPANKNDIYLIFKELTYNNPANKNDMYLIFKELTYKGERRK